MWYKKVSDIELAPSQKFSDWMQKPKNMGDAMRKVCKHLTLEVLEQTFGLPFLDEESLLELKGINDTTCYLRRVILLGDGIPYCFANVVIPKKVYLSHLVAFNSLGTKLIGETLLYNNPNTIREPFEFGFINKNDSIYTTIFSLNKDVEQKEFWGRRSVFKLNKSDPILITEIFFNTIPTYCMKEDVSVSPRRLSVFDESKLTGHIDWSLAN